MRIARRSFLKAAPFVGVAFRESAFFQTAIERTHFGPDAIGWARMQLLTLVNIERGLARLPQLEIDELACRVANAHAADMASGDFLSHWGRDGRKPYHRYCFAGGIDGIQENISAADNIQS